MIRLSAAVLLVAASVAVGPSAPGLAAGADRATPEPVIGKAHAFGAPTGEDGGISNSYVFCTGQQVEPTVRWDLTDVESGEKQTFRWTGALPNIAFPRLPVGLYTSHTVARCGEVKATRNQDLEVLQKTAETTMSRAEFKALEDGTTRREVREIVGYGGRSAGSYKNEHGRTYDLMPFWHWSQVVFTDGLLTDKYWDVAHD